MREIRTSGLMSGDGKRHFATAPVLDSTIYVFCIAYTKVLFHSVPQAPRSETIVDGGRRHREAPLPHGTFG